MHKYELISNRHDCPVKMFSTREKANKYLEKFLYQKDLQVASTRRSIKHHQEFICENGSFFSINRV